MKRVFLDTNFLLAPFTLHVDIYSELRRVLPGVQLCVLRGSLAELRKIMHTALKKTDKKSAKLALVLLEQKNVQVLDHDSYVDDALVELADGQTYVATADTALKRRLIKKHIPLVVLKQRKYLVLQEI